MTTPNPQRKTVDAQVARITLPGLPVALVAAAPAQKNGETAQASNRWKMVLYTGTAFRGHWYWGDVILDIAGFTPSRQDVPALRNHWTDEVAGYSEKISVDTSAKQILAEGLFLPGSAEEEPTATMIRRRLSSGYPYQASGRWDPIRIEQVPTGVQASVNGETITGPVTIFREYGLIECSFAELGWDEMSQAMAASKSPNGDQGSVTVEIIANKTQEENPMSETKPTSAAPVPVLSVLQELFGAERAIKLSTERPDAKDISAFLPELQAEVKTLSASVKDLQTKLDNGAKDLQAAQAELAEAKKAPVIITQKPDAAQPAAPAPKAGTPEALKAEWEKSQELQAKFPKFEWYEAEHNFQARKQAQQAG